MNAARNVYNPYVLHLLYVKMRYLQRMIVGGNTATSSDCYILNDWYAEILTRDIELMQSQMQKEKFQIDLCYCHYEHFIFRFRQLARAPGESMDVLFTGRHFECESNALTLIESRDGYKLRLQTLLRHYVEAFYFDPVNAKKKSERRVALLFHVKETLEKEAAIAENMLDPENMLFSIEYDGEMAATLFYVHLVEELFCLYEKENSRLEHVSAITDEFVFSKRVIYAQQQPQHASKAVVKNLDYDQSMLSHLSDNLRKTFRAQLTGRVTYHSKKTQIMSLSNNSEESWGFPSFIGTTTTTTNEKEGKSLNSEVLLDKPIDDTVAWEQKTINDVGSHNYYGGSASSSSSTQRVVPVFYIQFGMNRLFYTLFVYRIAFEVYLRDNHHHTTTTKTCYICTYFKRGKMARFFLLCSEEQVEAPGIAQASLLSKMKEELVSVRIDLVPSLNLSCFKTMANVFCLFESLNDERHTLTKMIDPVALLNNLSTTVNLTKLEQNMCEITRLCMRKVVFTEASTTPVLIVREQALAMDIELVRLINNALLDQMDEIRRYRRSISSLPFEKKEEQAFSIEVMNCLRRIYDAHVDVLCQVIAERRDAVQFT